MTAALHSSASNEHYTPPAFIDAATAVMGGIDLDPASTAEVNEHIVGAAYYFTKEDDGLTRPWHGRVWLNPPGGRVGNRSSAALWWTKLVDEYVARRVTQAVFLGFSIEILATAQDETGVWIGAVPFCIPRRRIAFLTSGAGPGSFVPGESPTHSNIIAYLPPLDGDVEGAIARFEKRFESFGGVRT